MGWTLTGWLENSPEPTAVVAVNSPVAVDVTHSRRLIFLRSESSFMCTKRTYLVCWATTAILLFFCCYGRTDTQGFHSGWLVTTRPGWLWFTNLVYLGAMAIGIIPIFFLRRM